MTMDQFDLIGWTGGMKAVYKNNNYNIGSVCFEEKLIGIAGYSVDRDDNGLHWIRCENTEISKSEDW